MSNKILITYSQLEASKKRFLETTNEINNLIRLLDSEIQVLKPKWQGLASDSFVRYWESKCKKDFLLLQNMCEQFAGKLDIVSNRMKETDEMLSFQMNNDKDILKGNISNSELSKPVTLPSEGDKLVAEMKPSNTESVDRDLSKPVTLPSEGDELVVQIKSMKPSSTGSVDGDLSKPVTLPSEGDKLIAEMSIAGDLSKPVILPS